MLSQFGDLPPRPAHWPLPSRLRCPLAAADKLLVALHLGTLQACTPPTLHRRHK